MRFFKLKDLKLGLYHKFLCVNPLPELDMYRTWPAHMQIYSNKRKRLRGQSDLTTISVVTSCEKRSIVYLRFG